MVRLRLQIARIRPHFRTALISGETGAGKSRVAAALHAASPVADRPSLTVDAANFEQFLRLCEPEQRDGLTAIAFTLGAAQAGTLLLDDLGDWTAAAQGALLQLLERQERTGSEASGSDKGPRLIACSRQDLRVRAASGSFRQELYQRLAAVTIAVPPLRQHKEDLPELSAYLLGGLAWDPREHVEPHLSEGALEALRAYSWPGNVRELENVLRSALIESGGEEITGAHFKALMELPTEAPAQPQMGRGSDRLQEVIDAHVLDVLRRCDGNKLRAAQCLGISRSTLYRMLDALPSSLKGG